MKPFFLLFLAVISEVIGTTSLKFSAGFTKLVPSIFVAAGYGVSFYLLSLSLKVIPLGLAYAIWSGVGIVLTSLIGLVIWRESIDLGQGVGMALIISGIFVLNLFSKTTVH